MNECEVNKKKLSEKKNTATTSGNVGVMLCNYADHVSRIVLFHNEFFFLQNKRLPKMQKNIIRKWDHSAAI